MAGNQIAGPYRNPDYRRGDPIICVVCMDGARSVDESRSVGVRFIRAAQAAARQFVARPAVARKRSGRDLGISSTCTACGRHNNPKLRIQHHFIPVPCTPRGESVALNPLEVAFANDNDYALPNQLADVQGKNNSKDGMTTRAIDNIHKIDNKLKIRQKEKVDRAVANMKAKEKAKERTDKFLTGKSATDKFLTDRDATGNWSTVAGKGLPVSEEIPLQTAKQSVMPLTASTKEIPVMASTNDSRVHATKKDLNNLAAAVPTHDSINDKESFARLLTEASQDQQQVRSRDQQLGSWKKSLQSEQELGSRDQQLRSEKDFGKQAERLSFEQRPISQNSGQNTAKNSSAPTTARGGSWLNTSTVGANPRSESRLASGNLLCDSLLSNGHALNGNVSSGGNGPLHSGPLRDHEPRQDSWLHLHSTPENMQPNVNATPAGMRKVANLFAALRLEKHNLERKSMDRSGVSANAASAPKQDKRSMESSGVVIKLKDLGIWVKDSLKIVIKKGRGSSKGASSDVPNLAKVQPSDHGNNQSNKIGASDHGSDFGRVRPSDDFRPDRNERYDALP